MLGTSSCSQRSCRLPWSGWRLRPLTSLTASGLLPISGMSVCRSRNGCRKPAPRPRGRNWGGRPFLRDDETGLPGRIGHTTRRGGACGRQTARSRPAHSTRWAAPSTACLNGWPAVKRTTRRAAIAAVAPVLGLRPTRARLARTCHVPKRRTLTGSPCRKLALMVVRMASTAASAWAVVHASSWAIRCTISAFLIVLSSVLRVDEPYAAPAVETGDVPWGGATIDLKTSERGHHTLEFISIKSAAAQGEDEPGIMEGTADVPLAAADLPEAAAVCDAATALDTTLAMVDPQPTLVELLAHQELLPRGMLAQIEINSNELRSRH